MKQIERGVTWILLSHFPEYAE